MEAGGDNPRGGRAPRAGKRGRDAVALVTGTHGCSRPGAEHAGPVLVASDSVSP